MPYESAADSRVRLEEANARISVLFARQGRSAAYTTQAARDTALNTEIASLRAHVERETARRTQWAADRETEQRRLETARAALAEKSALLEERRQFNKEGAAEWEELNARSDELLERKKCVWLGDAARCCLLTR